MHLHLEATALQTVLSERPHGLLHRCLSDEMINFRDTLTLKFEFDVPMPVDKPLKTTLSARSIHGT